MPRGTGRILLAWEGGAGRGHIVTLKTIAEALGDGFTYDAALCRMDHAAEIAPLCELAFQGANLWVNPERRRASGQVRTSTWGEFLGDLNFADPQFLTTQLKWWLDTIAARQSSMVIADMSPVALLAARVAGIPAVAIGTGYSVPPPGLGEFPILLPEFTGRIYTEAEMLTATNKALAQFGAAPLARFPEIYAKAISLPRTIPQLDPYNGRRTRPLLPPLNEALPRPGKLGDEIFIYFSTSELDDPALLEAVCTLGLPMRGYFPGLAAERAERLAAAGVVLEAGPVPVELIGERSRLMLHSGQHGSLCMGLGLGLVQVAFPQHLEHLFHARRAQALGTVDIAERDASAETLRDLIASAYRDTARHQRARDLSNELYPSLFGDIATLARQAILPALA